MDGNARRPSPPIDHTPTSGLPAPSGSGLSAVPPAIDVLDIGQCATWEDAKCVLLHWQVPHAQLPRWEALWRWDRLKERVAGGGVGRTDLDACLAEFYQRVRGERDSYRCLVPERDGERGHSCLKVVGRRDRMRGHIRSEHLGGVRVFQCEGQCGQDGCTKTFLQQRYLQQHVHVEMVQCNQCGKVIYKRNMRTHHCG